MTSPDHNEHEDQPQDDREDDESRRGGLVRRVLNQGPSPEQRLEELLAQRRSELDAHAERLRESIAELERREELLRDSRASVERMLRLGTSDLEAREAELTDFLASLTGREAALAEAEADLARRRQELGAVELKRAAVERRERALQATETELESRETEIGEREAEIGEREAEVERRALEAASRVREEEEALPVELVFVPGDRYRLVEIDPAPLTRGYAFDVGGAEFTVARIGPSPLPNDRRRCAYLVRGRGDLGAPEGSS